MTLPDLRRRLTRLARRRRRALAAALAAAGVLVGLSSLQSPPPVIAGGAESGAESPGDLRLGEVAVPVVLSSGAIARTLSSGDVIDVIGVSDPDAGPRRATVVASRARVLRVPDGGTSFGATATAVVLLAVHDSDALAVSAANTDGPVAVVIRTMAQRG